MLYHDGLAVDVFHFVTVVIQYPHRVGIRTLIGHGYLLLTEGTVLHAMLHHADVGALAELAVHLGGVGVVLCALVGGQGVF